LTLDAGSSPTLDDMSRYEVRFTPAGGSGGIKSCETAARAQEVFHNASLPSGYTSVGGGGGRLNTPTKATVELLFDGEVVEVRHVG
jgi:hypothetical protein